MTFTQRLAVCTAEDHDPTTCQAIDCIDDKGKVVWVSHAPNTTHPECRLNPDHPAEGLTAQPMCDDCRTLLE
jgi:hypothetical protein